MGTPHRGSELAAWSRVLSHVANAFLVGRIRTGLIKNLRSNSKELQDISAQSVERVKPLLIISFYEQLKLRPIQKLVWLPLSSIKSSILMWHPRLSRRSPLCYSFQMKPLLLYTQITGPFADS
jgi:hypothetical protein